MKHLLDGNQLSQQDIMRLIEQAMVFKKQPKVVSYPSIPVVNLFYENSTRTRISFELAAKQLGMPVINFDLVRSSESKGEIIEDTLSTLSAMGIKIAVIRHTQENLPHRLSEKLNGIQIINAGDGMHDHPSQGLLDMMTIFEQKSSFKNLKVAIVGNIKHSRVANAFQTLAAKLQIADLVFVAPTLWQANIMSFGRSTTSLKDGLDAADVIVCLRVQRERLIAGETIDLASYREEYALTKKTLSYAKKDVMVMHPGPVNRGVEIDSDVVDGPQSFILQQVTNGVFMRMAILDELARTTEKTTSIELC